MQEMQHPDGTISREFFTEEEYRRGEMEKRRKALEAQGYTFVRIAYISGKSERRQRIKEGMREKYFSFFKEVARRGEQPLLDQAMKDGESERKFRDRTMARWAREATEAMA